MKIINRLFSILLIIYCLFGNPLGHSPASATSVVDIGKSYRVTLEQGFFSKGILQYQISTAISNPGDTVEFISPLDLQLNEVDIFPKNTKFFGSVVSVQKPIQGKNGLIFIVIDRIVFPDGTEVPVVAHLDTKNHNGIIGGELTQRVGFRKVPHYVERLNDYSQFVPTGPRQMGVDTILKPGEEWVIVLDKKIIYDLAKD